MAETKTLVQLLHRWAEERPSKNAVWRKKPDGTWASLTWREYCDKVRSIARGLIALGHEAGGAVAIAGTNRVEWVASQLGVSAAGGIPAPIYPTSTDDQTAYILGHAGAKFAFVDGPDLLEKFLRCADKEDTVVEKIITFDKMDSKDERVISLEELEQMGSGDDEIDKRMAAAKPDDTSFFIFTSGTTGLPKGAELNHQGIFEMSTALIDTYPETKETDYIVVSYLPLSHVAEQIFTNFMSLNLGGEVYFCPDLKEVKEYLVQARPTLFLGVPRVWEKFEAAMRMKLGAATGIKAKLAGWARETELNAFKESVRLGRSLDTFSRKMANKLVISKVKAALGFDRLILAASGAAPISTDTLEFFASLGIVVHEAYGMTETSGVATVQPKDLPRFGTVGKPLPCVEVKIAEDGEILLKGPNMIKSYFKLPDKTAELYEGTPDWLHTGDIGVVDSDGFLKITGRKKDLIITAGGKNVAPAEIEQHLVTIPGVGQAVVVGDRQPYLSCLFALDAEAFGALAAAAQSPATTIEQIAGCEKVNGFVQKHIESNVNSKVAKYMTVKKFEILSAPFSVDGGELTPTMKVKRNVVNDKYKPQIDALYAGGTLNTPEKAEASAS